MKKLFWIKTIFAAVFLLIFVSSAVADEKTDKVDKLFAQWNKPDSPGCALAIIQDGKIIYKQGYGMANLEHSIPISPKSVFYIGSVSKQFVAMCFALLSKKEKLSLDDNIQKYIPEIPDYGTPITIRHLIHHTSGLRDYLTLLGIAGIPFGYYHEEDVLEIISRQKELNFMPGDKYLYSNSGYFLLAVIVERVSGISLRKYADKYIFKPLGMENSHFHDDYMQLIKNRASGYFQEGKGKYINFISTFDCVGSGGLFTSVEDLFLWDQNFYHHKVGGKDVMDLMFTRGRLNSGKELDYAFALSIGSYRGLKMVGHGGALGGYRSTMSQFPEQKFSIIILSNLSSFNPSSLSRKIVDIYLAGQIKEKAEAEAKPADKAKLAENQEYITLPRKKLIEKVGTYIQPETGEIIWIGFIRGKLRARVSNQNIFLATLSETEFHFLDTSVKTVLKFEKQNKGRPLLLHFFREGEEPETYESFKMPTVPPDKLKEYEGEYYSEELQVTFRVRLKKDKLYFVHKNAPKSPLKMNLKDNFTSGNLKIHFFRNEDEEIVAFTLDAGRVKNLRFDKK